MCWWTNKLLLRSMQGILLLASMLCFILAESASNEFTPLAGDACPGDVLTYTCTIIGGGSTIWSGSAFDCSSKSNEIILRHSQFASGMDGNCNGGAITARSLGVVDDTCYSSQLNLTFNLDLNNKTVQCAYSSETIESIGVATLSIATAPPPVRLAEIRPGELIFDWRPSINHLTSVSYNISTTCGTCPNMTNATMVTCSDLSLSTTLTMCTFSVRSVACGTIGTPSLPVVVTLGVPDTPNVKVTPQYDIDDEQSLTRIIVRVEQNVTSFSITDTISGSTTSYSIFYGSNIQNKTVCMEDNYCEYTVDIPPSFCSTSSVVDVTVVAANLLGFGRPTEPIILECINQFVRVDYDLVNAVLSCTFLNKSDSSPKSCSVIYGTCGQEMYTIQGSGIDGSPMIAIKLNSSIVRSTHCYVITASNGTYETIVNGSIALPMSEGDNNAVLSVIVVPIIVIPGIIAAIVIGLFFWRRRQHGNRASNEVQERELKKLGEHPQYEGLYPINSKHFTESAFSSTLNKFREQKGLKGNDIIFLEYKVKPKDVKNIRDVILRYKNEMLYTGPYARDVFNKEKDLSEWKNVFVLLHSGIKRKLTEGVHVLHQNPLEKSVRFKVLVVEKDSTLTDFMSRKKCYPFTTEQVFHEFLPTDEGFSLLHYVEVAIIEDSTQLSDESIVSLNPGIHYFYTVLKAPGENIKHPGGGRRVFIQGTANSLEQMNLTVGSLILYKVIDKAELTADDHAAIETQ